MSGNTAEDGAGIGWHYVGVFVVDTGATELYDRQVSVSGVGALRQGRARAPIPPGMGLPRPPSPPRGRSPSPPRGRSPSPPQNTGAGNWSLLTHAWTTGLATHWPPQPYRSTTMSWAYMALLCTALGIPFPPWLGGTPQGLPAEFRTVWAPALAAHLLTRSFCSVHPFAISPPLCTYTIDPASLSSPYMI